MLGLPRANAIGYAKFYSRSHDAVIHVYDEAGNVTGKHEQKGIGEIRRDAHKTLKQLSEKQG